MADGGGNAVGGGAGAGAAAGCGLLNFRIYGTFKFVRNPTPKASLSAESKFWAILSKE
jgi:hypothetical protein